MVQTIQMPIAAACNAAAENDTTNPAGTDAGDPECKIRESGSKLACSIPRPSRNPQYHYTSVDALEGLISDGHIRTCPWVDEDRLPENDYYPTRELICDVAWTSAHPVFEIAATSADCMVNDRTFAICDMLGNDPPQVARIEVDPGVLFEWTSYLESTGVSWDRLSYLLYLAHKIGSDPEDWAVCPHPIPMAKWLAIEIWDGNDWAPIGSHEDPEVLVNLGSFSVKGRVTKREELSVGGIWVRKMRRMGGSDWYGFLVADRIFRLKVHGCPKVYKRETIENLLVDESLPPVFRVLMAMQHLPRRCAAEVIEEAGALAVKTLEDNPGFASSVQQYCGLDRHTLIAAMKGRRCKFRLNRTAFREAEALLAAARDASK